MTPTSLIDHTRTLTWRNTTYKTVDSLDAGDNTRQCTRAECCVYTVRTFTCSYVWEYLRRNLKVDLEIHFLFTRVTQVPSVVTCHVCLLPRMLTASGQQKWGAPHIKTTVAFGTPFSIPGTGQKILSEFFCLKYSQCQPEVFYLRKHVKPSEVSSARQVIGSNPTMHVLIFLNLCVHFDHIPSHHMVNEKGICCFHFMTFRIQKTNIKTPSDRYQSIFQIETNQIHNSRTKKFSDI